MNLKTNKKAVHKTFDCPSLLDLTNIYLKQARESRQDIHDNKSRKDIL